MLMEAMLVIGIVALLISLVVNRFFGFMAAAVVWITLFFMGYTFIVYLIATFFYESGNGTWSGNFIWIVMEGPFALWFSDKAFNNIMSWYWRKFQEPKMDAEIKARLLADKTNTPPVGPY